MPSAATRPTMPWWRAISAQASVAARSVSRITAWTVTVRSISSNGRPISAHRSRRTSLTCAIRSGAPKPFHRSAWRAVVRSVLVGPGAADEDRQAFLDRPRGAHGVVHRVEASVVGDPLPVEQPPDEPDRLVEPVEPFAEARPEVEPERVVLGLEPAATEAEDEASARQVVDRGRELRGQPRTAERVGADEQAQADALGHRGERRDRRPALELRVGRIALVGQQVIVDPQRVPAGALGGETRVAQLGPGRSLDPERRAEAHRSPRARVAYRRSVSGPPDFPPALRDAILDWYVARARSLPFRGSTDPYAILVSEAMAQQTQAARAGDAWTRFMDRFPTVEALAAATPADVLRAWQGLGYNRRALNLWRAARRIVDEFGGRVPADLADLESLPGVGPYTARAVAALAFGLPGRRGRHQRAPRPWADRRRRRRAA